MSFQTARRDDRSNHCTVKDGCQMPARGDLKRQADDVHNPFDVEPPRISEYTAQEIAILQSRLDRQLGPEYISTRQGPGGSKVHYLAAEKVINLANEVFGFNGWSSTIVKTDIDYVDQDKDNKISMGVSMIMRVTLRDGTFHEDIGYGEIRNSSGKGAAFEKTKKEAATDALKRALRNFGNVLGNCLYDKSYLQKVTKIKAPPSKWSENDLHRHHEFISRTEVAPTEKATSLPRRTASEQSRGSFGNAEFDDEFGGNLFDDSDFLRPDEVKLDPTTDLENSELSTDMPFVHVGRSLQRPQSRNQLRPQANAEQNAPPNQVQMRPCVQQRSNGPTNTTAQGRVPLPPVPRLPPQLPPQQRNPNSPHKPPGAHSVQPRSSTPEGLQQKPPVQQPDNHLIAPQHVPDTPVGFVTGRAAPLLQGPAAALRSDITFNPHSESPSIRKTTGVDHRRSGPVRRDDVGAPLPPVPPAPPAQSTTFQTPQGPALQPQPVPGALTPNSRANFINPQADSHRRIGMPPQPHMHSPGPRPGGYKPPGPAGIKRGPPDGINRTPLGELSNANRVSVGDGMGEKRVRVEGHAGEQQN